MSARDDYEFMPPRVTWIDAWSTLATLMLTVGLLSMF